MKAIKGHDRPEEEEGQVEVVLQQVGQGIAVPRVGTVLQREAGTTQDREASTAQEQHLLEIKSACYKPALEGREQASGSPGAPLLGDSPAFPQGCLMPLFPRPTHIGHGRQHIQSVGVRGGLAPAVYKTPYGV